MTTMERDTAKEQARMQLDGIIELMKALPDGGEVDGGTLTGEQVSDRIQEDPLSIQVRTDWYTPGETDNKPTDYNILLCTGGPACRIIGELDQYCQPENARIEYQDWFTPWTEYRETTTEEDHMLLQYTQQFYFGD